LPFLLISDRDKALQRAFGVPKTMGLLPGRVTYVIDRDGKVQHLFNSQLNATKHVREALDVVKRLSA
jgi:peroxiredoxin Q/BCP